MNSASQDRVGAASGINNAVARVAGVLAIAVLGIVMANGFSSQLNQRVAKLSLPPDILQEIRANESKLAGLQLSASVKSSTRAEIRQLVAQAFVSGFRLVMLISACLSIASAVIAWLLIPAGQVEPHG
jgi:hypothetical protein